jgi:hypothetical protein
MRWSASVGFALMYPFLLAWASPAFSDSPVSCSSEKLVSENALQVTLSRRSVEIIRLAERGNVEGLRAFVPASAKFNMGTHDVIMEIGVGPEGAVMFADGLRVSDFQFTMMDSGPPAPVSPCSEQSVNMLLLQPGGKQAYQATFQYRDGQLTNAWAHDIYLFAGKIQPK